ncbi:MAG: hypothetical protein ACJA1B_001429 [Polaribacter sp.]|jgi:hypothetical protein
MEFKEALEILGIEKYSERIINSNSKGELIHLYEYFIMAQTIGKTNWFANWFEEIVKYAEDEWKRPESVFQHIAQLLEDQIKASEKHQ